MGFTEKQLRTLRRSLNGRHVRTRVSNGRELSYIEGWYAISEANRIFGFDAWCRETVETRCALARENRGSFLAVYVARVRITVHADGATIVREGHGSGEGRGTSPGEVHDIALKAAETDATKRALATFGRPFGLELYRKDKKGILEHSPTLQPVTAVSPTQPRLGSHPDDTTPIPRPSHYYGRRHQGPMSELLRRDHAKTRENDAVTPPLAPEVPTMPTGKIDKSQLAIAEPKRLRDKAHLKFVASQPCLVCGRQPSDSHHLRFAIASSVSSSAMNSPSRSVAGTIGSFTKWGMKKAGGQNIRLTYLRWLNSFGSKTIFNGPEANDHSGWRFASLIVVKPASMWRVKR